MSDVLVAQTGAITTITINRPERRNGVTVETCRALYRATQDVAASDARVVILRGASEHFCVGADIGGGPADGADGPAPDLHALGFLHHAATLLHTMPQVTIAAIDGGCAGAGMGYALACDFRFASTEARFSTAFLNVAVSGDMGLAWGLNRVVGAARMRELLFFPDKLDAARALDLGIVTRVFARETLHAQVMELAEQLAARDPLALRLVKANCLSAEELPIGAFIDIETARQLQCTARPNLRELMAAGLNRAKG